MGFIYSHCKVCTDSLYLKKKEAQYKHMALSAPLRLPNTYSQILSHRFELLADIWIVALFSPLCSQHFESLFQNIQRSHRRRISSLTTTHAISTIHTCCIVPLTDVNLKYGFSNSVLVPTITLFISASASLPHTMGVNAFFFFFAGWTMAGVAGASFWNRMALSCLFLSSAGVSSIFPIVEVVFFVPVFALHVFIWVVNSPRACLNTHCLWNKSTELGFFVVIHALLSD